MNPFALNHKCHRRNGFTLLEMSIVLSVIALIIAGVFMGQSLIRSAQLNTVIGNVSRYTQAMNNFRDKFRALPGDFAGATALWGAASGGCPVGERSGTQTCDGNGDGRIAVYDYATTTPVYIGTEESELAWQHLALSGFIDGSYTGLDSTIRSNIYPPSGLPNSNFNIWYINNPLGNNINFYRITQSHVLILENLSAPLSPVLSAVEAAQIDSKMDDGIPGSGAVQAMTNFVTSNCDNASISPGDGGYYTMYNWAGTYDNSDAPNACTLLFLLSFK